MKIGPTSTRNTIVEAVGAVRGYFLFAALFSLAVNLLYLAPALYMMQVYDRVISSGSIDTLIYLTLIVSLAILVMCLLDQIRSVVLVRASNRIDRLLAQRVFVALIDQGVGSGSARNGQALRDLDTVRQFVTTAGALALFDAPWMPIYLGLMFVIHPIYGSIALAAGSCLLALAWVNEQMTRPSLSRANLAANRNYAATEAMLRNAEVVHALGMQHALLQRWNRDRTASLGHQSLASDRSAFFQSMIKFIRLLLQSLILGVGAWLVIDRQLTSGEMFAGVILVGRAMAPIELMVGAWRQFVGARDGYERVRTLLSETRERPPAMPLPTPKGRLQLERVGFGHPGTAADKYVIKGVTFTVDAGESVGVIGPTAAGKSTLARLAVGCWKPSFGTVRLDNADVSTWDRNDLGRHIGYLPQTVELFAGSIRENIARFQDAAPDAVLSAATQAGVHDLILRLPDGYETQIGDGGAVLSGGQRQRVGLARALFGSPRLVVLDEPNAHLDLEGEQALLSALRQLKDDGVTVLIIAHRPAILAGVDKLMILKEGAIEAFGARQDILSKLSGPPQVPRPSTPARPITPGVVS